MNVEPGGHSFRTALYELVFGFCILVALMLELAIFVGRFGVSPIGES